MRLNFSESSIKPEELGLPKLRVKSCGNTVYLPRFDIDFSYRKGLIIEFGHYWGFGRYFVASIVERGYGLDLYGGDDSPCSSIEQSEMVKVRKYLKKYRKVIRAALLKKWDES